MKNGLLDVVFASEKRKNVLLLLKDGKKSMETFLEVLDTTRQALLPQIKILEEHHLLSHHDHCYELTPIGKLLIEDMSLLVSTIGVFDQAEEYWGTHNIDFIPPHLLKRLRDLKEYRIISPSVTELYSIHKSFHRDKTTQSIYKVTNFLYPDHKAIFTELIDANVTFYYIVSKELLGKIRAQHAEDFRNYILSGHFNLYVCNRDIDFLFFTFDDYHIIINLFSKDGRVDSKYVLCSTRDALEWGKELYEHYLKESAPVRDI
ncbi:helix-turn-helix transcriptional regulator [Methanolobus chelungpuianus]|uniref:Transcriptional regulator n=1 Tax=Methanolobus chelungpuianus TaxID=502115 RepID=A0AAE3HC49_9EURY|nr:winged helix-turn-helix domain-containing protein [Methanolobus chelungpuianus]MCQ6963535.1 transcriptional regulator [Methanolobus chelungpuianus]